MTLCSMPANSAPQSPNAISSKKLITRRIKTRFCTALFTGTCAISLSASTAYSNIPATLPPDFPESVAYEGLQASEFGGIVQPDFTNGNSITAATVAVTNWAVKASYPGFGDDAGYQIPLTLTLYNVNANGSVGSTIASSTTNAHIAWRRPSTGCLTPDGTLDGYQIERDGHRVIRATRNWWSSPSAASGRLPGSYTACLLIPRISGRHRHT